MSVKQFSIPDELLGRIRERDRNCVYCGKEMIFPYSKLNRKDSATIEHLNRDGPFYWGEEGLFAEDIVICCSSCNSSRGRKLLAEWFLSAYCRAHGINADTVAEPVRDYIAREQ